MYFMPVSSNSDIICICELCFLILQVDRVCAAEHLQGVTEAVLVPPRWIAAVVVFACCLLRRHNVVDTDMAFEGSRLIAASVAIEMLLSHAAGSYCTAATAIIIFGQSTPFFDKVAGFDPSVPLELGIGD